jgi:hypothetical protein
MTMPNERTRSIFAAKRFLLELLNSKETKRVPKEIRRRAYSVLRHFPSAVDLIKPAKSCPDVFDSKAVDDELERLEKEFDEIFQRETKKSEISLP